MKSVQIRTRKNSVFGHFSRSAFSLFFDYISTERRVKPIYFFCGDVSCETVLTVLYFNFCW